MINPYYTTYMLSHRFPGQRPIATEQDLYTRQVWQRLSDYGGSAYRYMRDMIIDPVAPLPASPVVVDSPVVTATPTAVVTSPTTTTVVRA
jgi:hypothetical protein